MDVKRPERFLRTGRSEGQTCSFKHSRRFLCSDRSDMFVEFANKNCLSLRRSDIVVRLLKEPYLVFEPQFYKHIAPIGAKNISLLTDRRRNITLRPERPTVHCLSTPGSQSWRRHQHSISIRSNSRLAIDVSPKLIRLISQYP